jgi:hypothetical protein
MIASAQSKVELIFLSVAMNLNGAFLMSNFMWRRVIGRGVIYRERTIGIPLLIALAFVAAAIFLFRYV